MIGKKAEHRAVVSALNTIRNLNMVEDGDSILISVSGGPDSVFLTYIFQILKERLDLELYGFSLDHSTRDGQSGRDLEFVKKLYKELNIKLFSRKVDAADWCRKHRLSFQEGARKLRMDLLRDIAKSCNIMKIALGHNLDDNIETFLMRLIRGSGARGLSGISPVNNEFIRPLINTSRGDIEDYLKLSNIQFCVDRSNLEDKYVRNRIRNKLIPFIRDNFSGDLTTSIKRSMEILKNEDIFLRKYSSDILNKSAGFRLSSDGRKTIYIKIPIISLNSNSSAVRRRVVLAALEKILGSLEDISYRNVKDILKLAYADTGESKWFKPVASLIVFRINGFIHMADMGFIDNLDPDIRSYIMNKSGSSEKEEGSLIRTIKIGGETGLPEFSMAVRSKLISDPGIYDKLPDSKAIIDYSKVLPPIEVRSWKKGDRFYPLGLKGSKKLQDFFIDNKIPINRRKKIPVFYDREKIIWVGNMRIDSRVRITSGTSDFLYLELFEK